MLLDRAGVKSGSRLLDIGCGYGRLLRAAAGRGARAWGITVSPEQVRRGTRVGLDVRLLDYKRLGREWDGQFDSVIANGSLEHFAQPADAVAGHDDDIYRPPVRHRQAADRPSQGREPIRDHGDPLPRHAPGPQRLAAAAIGLPAGRARVPLGAAHPLVRRLVSSAGAVGALC